MKLDEYNIFFSSDVGYSGAQSTFDSDSAQGHHMQIRKKEGI